MNFGDPSALRELMDAGKQREQNQDFFAYTIHAPDGSPYLSRLLLPRAGDARPMLHCFHQSDKDQFPHNHPWEHATSYILHGAYKEHRFMGHTGEEPVMHQQTFYPGGVNELTASTFHSVELLTDEVWTFFIVGPRVQGWGFLKDYMKFVDWREYLGIPDASHSMS